MKIVLKIFAIFLLVFHIVPFSSAYNSSEAITLYVEDPDVWTSIYTVPEGKDLILNRIYTDNANAIISIRNSNDSTSYSRSGKEEYFGGFLVIKDDLQIITDPANNVGINLFGYLVSEDEEVQYYLDQNSDAWNKHIFDREDIEYIYFVEFVIIFFLVVFKFFSIILGRKFSI